MASDMTCHMCRVDRSVPCDGVRENILHFSSDSIPSAGVEIFWMKEGAKPVEICMHSELVHQIKLKHACKVKLYSERLSV